MTHAELLRSHADAALREGGMYYSGEYLSRMASVAESLEAENAKLRELCADLRFCRRHDCLTCSHGRFCDMKFDERCAKLGIEADG